MADIVLAEHNGQTWLMSGETFIDDLLANTLQPDVTIEFVVCESESDLENIKARHLAAGVEGFDPWIIHPAIARRMRWALSGDDPSGYRVVFGAWSAARDADADEIIAAAARAAARSEARVVLTSYIAPDGPPPLADLAALRGALIEAELTRLGVPASRIVRSRHDGDASADHIDIKIEAL
jgi:hypothetical protein